MNAAKELLRWIIIIPNVPILTALALCLFLKIRQNTTPIELEFVESGKDYLTPEIKNYVTEIYPKYFSWSVAIVFYGSIFFNY